MKESHIADTLVLLVRRMVIDSPELTKLLKEAQGSDDSIHILRYAKAEKEIIRRILAEAYDKT